MPKLVWEQYGIRNASLHFNFVYIGKNALVFLNRAQLVRSSNTCKIVLKVVESARVVKPLMLHKSTQVTKMYTNQSMVGLFANCSEHIMIMQDLCIYLT